MRYLYLLIFTILFSFSSFLYYQNLKYKNQVEEYIKTIQIKSGELDKVVKLNKENLENFSIIEKDLKETIKKYSDVIDELRIIELNKQELFNKLKEHNLKELSLAKPQLIENILNKSSNEYNNCIEVITGMQKNLTYDNNECPWLKE